MPETTASKRSFRIHPVRILMYTLLVLGALVCIFPFIWMFLTSFKTYGEHSTRVFWPRALTIAPYTDLPESYELELELSPTSTDAWGGAPSSQLPLMEGQFELCQVAAPVQDQMDRSGVELPVTVLILIADTNSEVDGYDTFYYTVESRVIQQGTTRALLGQRWKAPYYLSAPDMQRWGPQLIVTDNDPEHFTLRVTWQPVTMFLFNYLDGWTESDFGKYMWNSVRLTVIQVVGVVLFSTMASYALARMNFPGRNVVFTLFLATLMLPEVVTLIPNFYIVIQLNRFFENTFGIQNAWLNNWTALTIPFMASTFSIFLLRQFFAQIPNELYDAALIDGCGHTRFLVQIVIPLSKAPLMSVVIFNGIWSWNSFLWPLIVTTRDTWRPITVGLSKFIEEAGSRIHLMMAGAAIAIIPILILYFFTQKQFTEGITTTGLKG
ncbi:MAG: carbohydrate ABC transporter permease [Anaerolineae bacterium]|nr:carbohydrate ABC transporter permease [Anaerolineae bacterium]